jgi:hypothetical protein
MQTMNAEDKIPEAGKPDEIEITPEMIEAGVMAYYGVASEGWGWEAPDRPELKRMVRSVFQAMVSLSDRQRDTSRRHHA